MTFFSPAPRRVPGPCSPSSPLFGLILDHESPASWIQQSRHSKQSAFLLLWALRGRVRGVPGHHWHFHTARHQHEPVPCRVPEENLPAAPSSCCSPGLPGDGGVRQLRAATGLPGLGSLLAPPCPPALSVSALLPAVASAVRPLQGHHLRPCRAAAVRRHLEGPVAVPSSLQRVLGRAGAQAACDLHSPGCSLTSLRAPPRHVSCHKGPACCCKGCSAVRNVLLLHTEMP